MTLLLRYAAKSDVGMVRPANEDSGFAGRSLLAVADGMGGHAAGELASSTAIATLAELDSEDLPTESLLTALDDAIVTSAERIGQFIQADPTRAGMGTTVTAILWRAGRIAVIHVGDSRAYLLRNGELTQITHDHTYVQSLIDAGRISAEQARRHPKRNLLLRAIDGNQMPEGETSMREAQVGDRYLLCSDGLSGVVDDAAIARTLGEESDPTAAVTTLVDLALEGGAPDNVTVVVADVVDVPDDEIAREAGLSSAVVVGAAGEQRNRAALPGLQFPDDVSGHEPIPSGPEVVGGLAARTGDRTAAGAGGQEAHDTGVVDVGGRPVRPGSIGEAIETGEVAVGAASGPSVADDLTRPDALEDPEASRSGSSRPRFLRRHVATIAGVAVVVLALLLGLVGFVWWLGSQWYVGQTNGYVTISRGVPQQVLGLPLNRVTTTTALAVDTLPIYDQGQLALTIDASSASEAQRIVVALEVKSQACTSDSPPLGCPTNTGSDDGSGSQPTAPASPAVQAGRQSDAPGPGGGA